MALINLRNALMAGKRLPYDAEIEYLESTGTQYIEVPMVVGNSATVNITGYVGKSNTELFSFDRISNIAFNIESGATYYRWWANTPTNIGSGYVGALHSYKCNSSIWVDSVLKGTSTAIFTFSTHIFYILNGVHGATSGRIYHVSVEYGGALIFDFIPVRVGSVGYMYDRVSGKLFGNAGTGDFVLGPDVVPVEYIESHGTEYIDTGIIPTTVTEVEATVMPTDQTEPRFMFGCRAAKDSNTYACLLHSSNRIGYRVGNGSFVYKSGYSEVGAIHKYGVANGVFYRDGAIVSNACAGASLDVNTALALLSINTNGTPSQWFVGRLYSCAINNNSTPLRSFRPVRVGIGSTWEGAMMDVLTRRIHRNEGTGAFEYGGDLKYPIPSA